MTAAEPVHSELEARPEIWTRAALPFLCGFVLVASLVLGGGTRSGFLSDAILQLIATPLLLLASWHLLQSEAAHKLRPAFFFCAALVLVPLLQLLPLPPPVWTALPGRDAVVEAFTLTGRELTWMPISVSPHDTWLGLISLVVPLSIFLATVQLRRRERRIMSLVVLAVGVVSVFLGLLQVAQGPDSPLRFFDFTNPTEAVGFFANRNHFAALLYSLTLLAAAWTVHASAKVTSAGTRKAYDTPLILALLAGLAVIVALIAAQMMARSRAGLALAIVALLGVWALAVRDRPGGTGVTAGRLLAGAIGLALVFGVQFALYRVLDRFEADPLSDARIPFALNTIEAAKAFMPLGSGVGTFVPVYAMFERLEDARHFYANRAHNDVLEAWLESGVAALLLMGLFLIWLIWRNVSLWRETPRPGGEIDLLLARSAALALVLLSAHSLVDYPLRTAALMAIFAFAAALLFEPPDEPRPSPGAGPRARARKHSAGGPPSGPAPQPPFRPEPRSRSRAEDWPDMEWPEAWRPPKASAAEPPASQSPGPRKRSESS